MYVLIIFCDILNLEHNFTTCIIKCMSVVIEVLIGVWVLFVWTRCSLCWTRCKKIREPETNSVLFLDVDSNKKKYEGEKEK